MRMPGIVPERYFQDRGTRATAEIAPELSRMWGDPASRRTFRCLVFVRAGRVSVHSSRRDEQRCNRRSREQVLRRGLFEQEIVRREPRRAWSR
jgi:hypothetical protein